MPFVLRGEGDTENPPLATVYGHQITAGKLAYFIKEGRMKCILILGEGEMDGVDKVYYNGEILPEYSSGTNPTRNWRFHPGTLTTQVENFYDVTAISTDTLTLSSNPFIVGDEVALVAGVDPETSPYPTSVEQHKKLFVVYSSGNNIRLGLTSGGAAITGWAVSSQYLLDNLKVYKADAGYFDPLQGRPEFFPAVDFTLSGIAYIEVNLPAEMSEIEEEPTKFKIFVRGRRLQNYDSTGMLADPFGVAYNPLDLPDQTKHFSANNALVAMDIILNYMKVEKTRIDWPSWVRFRDYCDEQITWNSGSIKVLANPITTMSANVDTPFLGTYTKVSGATSWDSGVLTDNSTSSIDNIVVSGVYQGGTCTIGLIRSAVIPTTQNPGLFALNINPTNSNIRAYVNGSLVHTSTIPYQVGDTFKVEVYEDSVNFYKNDTIFHTEASGMGGGDPIRGYITFNTVSASISDFKFYPVTGADRVTNRFDAHVVFPQQTDSSTALQQVMGRAPSVHWQDVNGKIKFMVGGDFADVTWGQTPEVGQRVLADIFAYDPDSTSFMRVLDPTLTTEQNFALRGDVSASSSYSSNYPASSVADGVTVTNGQWGTGQGWHSLNNASELSPEWLVIDWKEPRPINKINVYTLADAIQYASITEGQTFTLYGIQDFLVQYWNGASWTTLDNVVGNNLVKRTFVFPIITTDKIRILITKTVDGKARVIEVEAIGPSVIHDTVPTSNIIEDSFSAYKTPPENKPNFLRIEVRDLDDPYYSKKYVYNDRSELRDQTGTLVDFGIVPLGVATQSLADRVGEATMRWGADLDLFIALKTFGSTYAVSKGDVVKVAHEIPNWGLNRPGQFIVLEETIEPSTDSADDKSYLLQAYNPEYYSDDSHGTITGNYPVATSPLTPPPALENLTLSEESRTLPDNTHYNVIVGRATFNNVYPYTQRARVYWKRALDVDFIPTSVVLEQPNTGVTEIAFELPFAETGLNEVKVVTETVTGILSTASVIEEIDISGTIHVEEVSWENFVNTTTLSGELLKSINTNAWDAGAQSDRAIAYGDGYMQFTTRDKHDGIKLGFSVYNYADYSDSMKYGIELDYETLPKVWVDGTQQTITNPNIVTAGPAQSYKIEIVGNEVKFYQIVNSEPELMFTTANQDRYPLHVDASIYTANGVAPRVRIYGNLEQNTGNRVHWGSVRSVDVGQMPNGDEIITKIGQTGWYDAASSGTFSRERITKNGAVEFTIDDTGTYRMLGFSEEDAGIDTVGVKYAWYPEAGGNLTARYEGTIYYTTSYQVGDILRIERVDGKIRFRKNGELMYAPDIAPFINYNPLYIDTAFYTVGGTIANVRLKKTGNFTSVRYPYPIYLVEDLSIIKSRPQDDGNVYFELAGDFNVIDEYPILRAKVLVIDKFGTELELFPPFTYAGHGLIAWGYHDRKYADPLEEAIYRVELDNGAGWSAPIYTKAGTETFSAPPYLNPNLAVQNLTCAPVDHTSISLSWTYSGNIDIWRRVEGTTSWGSPIATNVSTKPRVIANLVSNTYYEFRAAPTGTTSNYSNICRQKTLQAPLPPEEVPPPTGLVATLNSANPSTSVDLSWNRNSTDNTGVKIYQDGVLIYTGASATQTTHTVSGLTASTEYDFTVRNISSKGDSIDSNVATITTGSGSSAQAPTGLYAIATDSTKIALGWTNNTASGNIEIHRSTDNTSFTLVDTISASESVYNDVGLLPLTTYWYKVKNSTVSGFSNTSSATTWAENPSCVLLDTLIWVVIEGRLQEVEARHVQVGHEVLTITKGGNVALTKVKKVRYGSSDAINVITTSEGNTLDCTPSHPLVVDTDINCVKSVLIKRKDKVLAYNPKLDSIQTEMVESKETLEGDFRVLIFELEGEDHTFVSNNIVSHNRKIDEPL